VVVVVFFFNEVSSTKTSFTLSQLPADDEFDPTYIISPTDRIQNTFGSLEISLDGNKCNTLLDQEEGNVFFEVKKGNRFCVILSYVKSNEKVAQVYFMQGTFCSITKNDGDGDFVVSALDNHLANCRWNGKKCLEITEGIRVEYQLEGIEYKMSSQIEMPYAQTGGRISVDSDNSGYAVITNYINGFLYFNVTHKNGNSWCLVSAETHLRDYHPMSLIYQAHHALCTVKEISYHTFSISAEKLEGACCTFDGLECKLPEELLKKSE